MYSQRVELINKCKFAEAILDKNANFFVIHVVTLEVLGSAMLIEPLRTLLLAAL